MRSLVRWLFPALLCGCTSASQGSGTTPVTVAPVVAPTTTETPEAPPAAPTVDCKKSPGKIESEPPPTDAGWVKKGQIVITMVAGAPVQIEVRDAYGAVLKVIPNTSKDKQVVRALVSETVCEAGGLAAVPAPNNPRHEPKDGLIIADVIAPDVEDERADLKKMCEARPRAAGEPPMSAIADMDSDLKWMTSRRLRLFHQRVLEMMEVETPRDGITRFHDRADELAQIAADAGIHTCNYVNLLRDIP